MAQVNQLGKGKITLKMQDTEGQYSENLGYAVRDVYAETDTQVVDALQYGLAAVASLMNATYVQNKITYEFEVGN